MNFAQPVWLVLLVLLPLLGVAAILVSRLRKNQWQAFIAPRLRGSLLKRGSPLPRWFALLFLLASCMAAILALARPQGESGTRIEKSLGRNILIALDLSRSMRTQDVKPDRLSQAKMIIYELLESMPNERVGLLGFAGTSYIYAPLTVDHAAIHETVEQIDENWAPVGGSDLAAALRLATDTLKKTGQKNNAMVILSDGEKHEGKLDRMIDEARESGVFILSIGVGTENGDYIPNKDFPENRMIDKLGKPIISRLQPDVMRKLATETKGRYALAGSGVDIPAMVKSFIKDLDAFELEGRERRVSIEFYQWLVLPAIVFLFGSVLAGTRWRGVNAAIVTACLFLTANSSKADAVSEAKAALNQQRFPEAIAAYRKLAEQSKFAERKAQFHLGEATAAYRAEDFEHARSAFSKAMLGKDSIIQANAHLGMGNTLFQLGWRSISEKSYAKGSASPPSIESFDELVRERLEKLKASKNPDEDELGGYRGIKSLVTDWTDAVRHFDSAHNLQPSDMDAKNNRDLTVTYLNRLYELLDEDKKDTQQSMPAPQPNEAQPQPGEGQPKDKQDGENGNEKNPGESGENGENPKDPNDSGDDGPPKQNDKPGEKPDDKNSNKNPQKPGETPEERARRILNENADLEKGPLTPGRRELLDPEKDW
ncbi:MAG: VWA domain-containing protein [Gloeobacteraceae cyanobacterium ES-bin-144]|nr:VWA domain-containing protein [Verrucomicrobiales bacterium]